MHTHMRTHSYAQSDTLHIMIGPFCIDWSLEVGCAVEWPLDGETQLLEKSFHEINDDV